MLAGRPPFGFLGWFQRFCFSFGVSCLHAWYGQPLIFRLPPAFVVWTFLAIDTCVQSLSFTAFSAVGLCVVFALLALVSGYPCTSQFLISCCALAARQLDLEIETGNFSKSRLPCGHPYKFCFEANPIWYSIKFTKSHSAKCSLHKWAWLMKRRSIKVSSFELYKCEPFSPHSGSILWELVHSYALGCLWVVTVCWNTVGRHG